MQNYAYIAQSAPHIKEVPMGMFGKLGWELGINAPIGMETSNGCGYNAHSTKEEREAAEKKKQEERQEKRRAEMAQQNI